MKEVLIINLTRMGDLLQTTPLMAGLKESFPGLRLTLVVNSAFAEICNGIPFIDELITFDMRGFRERLIKRQHSLVENFRCIEALINDINRKEYDLAINLTHSPASALLISLVRAKEIKGFTVDSEGHRVIRHPWMRYFFNVVPNREFNPFHLVDMYLKVGGVKPNQKGLFYEVSAKDEEKAAFLLRQEGITGHDLLIGLPLGASKKDRQWPVSSFARLASLIVKATGAKILLFGSSAEAEQARQFRMLTDINPVDFMGRTDLGLLSALLKRCALLVSNDTGPLHLATSVGTKVIGLFLVNAHFTETGPYGEDHYVVEPAISCAPCGFNIQCKERVCIDLIKPEAVFELVKEILSRGSLTSIADSALWENVQVYRSHFKDDGLLGFYPLIRRPLTKEALYTHIYRHLWNSSLDDLTDEVVMTSEDLYTEISSYYLSEGLREVIASLRNDLKAIKELITSAEKAVELIGLIAAEAQKSPVNVALIKDIWKKVEPLDSRIELLGHTNPFLRPIISIFKYTREALEGDDLPLLAEASCRIYKEMAMYSSGLLQLVSRLLSHITPERDYHRSSTLQRR